MRDARRLGPRKRLRLMRLRLQLCMRAVRVFPAEWSAEQKVERFLTEEARRGVSASTQNQALNAIVFVCQAVLGKPLGKLEAARAVRKEHVRVAISVAETRDLLAALEDYAIGSRD